MRVRIGKPLSAGWFSIGHEGTIEGSNQRVAVKIWNPKWQEHQRITPTYSHDDQLLTHLSAVNPAWVHSLGTGIVETTGEKVLVTEFAEGITLGARREARGIGKSVRIMTRILRAIGDGHKLGYGLHDLNTGNEI